MGRSRFGKKRAGLLGLLGIAAIGALKQAGALPGGVGRRLDTQLFRPIALKLDAAGGWDRLPLPLKLGWLIEMRRLLRERNLYDTYAGSSTGWPEVGPPSPRHLTERTADGTYNDLGQPAMGSAGTRFGRNVPIEATFPDKMPELLEPNPRAVSRELLTRESFIPATTLNMLAAAWIQFMVRDWFSHGPGPKDNLWELELAPDDPWPDRPMRIPRVPDDPHPSPESDGLPPTHVNFETHWWDASQIYGSSQAVQDRVRSHQDGKLVVGPDGSLPDELLGELVGTPGGWLGLVLMQTLFALEHNAICDRLRAEYPSWSDEDLFQHARLINAALLAKIHTVEWTPAILGQPAMELAMRTNWWGIAGERIHNLLGRISGSEVISGIIGGSTDHFGVPYSLTEEFVSVYRMHPLIRDEYTLRSAQDDAVLGERTFRDIAGPNVKQVLRDVAMADLFYSFGIANPGAITLHNFPRFLQTYERPDGKLMDLAATDILRSRELGVPRYNEFRRLLQRPPVESFEELSDNPAWAEQLRRVYGGDIERVDLMVGLYAERPPTGFGFSDSALRIFILMASRRLNSDRFFTTDYTPQAYTRAGLDWIADNGMETVLIRHFPALAPALRGVRNPFAPWRQVGA